MKKQSSASWILSGVVAVATPSKSLAYIQILDPSLVFPLMVANIRAHPMSSCEVFSPFLLFDQQSAFGMLITLSCLRSCSGEFEGLFLCVWVVSSI